MQNKDLLWVRADYAAGKIAPENPAQKPSKKHPFVDDGSLDTFTVSQIASMWQLSTDTIQRWFQDEPGVIASDGKKSHGKRSRITLRIPRNVLERVKRKRARK